MNKIGNFIKQYRNSRAQDALSTTLVGHYMDDMTRWRDLSIKDIDVNPIEQVYDEGAYCIRSQPTQSVREYIDSDEARQAVEGGGAYNDFLRVMEKMVSISISSHQNPDAGKRWLIDDNDGPGITRCSEIATIAAACLQTCRPDLNVGLFFGIADTGVTKEGAPKGCQHFWLRVGDNLYDSSRRQNIEYKNHRAIALCVDALAKKMHFHRIAELEV